MDVLKQSTMDWIDIVLLLISIREQERKYFDGHVRTEVSHLTLVCNQCQHTFVIDCRAGFQVWVEHLRSHNEPRLH